MGNNHSKLSFWECGKDWRKQLPFYLWLSALLREPLSANWVTPCSARRWVSLSLWFLGQALSLDFIPKYVFLARSTSTFKTQFNHYFCCEANTISCSVELDAPISSVLRTLCRCLEKHCTKCYMSASMGWEYPQGSKDALIFIDMSSPEQNSTHIACSAYLLKDWM